MYAVAVLGIVLGVLGLVGTVDFSLWAVIDARKQVRKSAELQRNLAWLKVQTDLAWELVNLTEKALSREIAKAMEEFTLLSKKLDPGKRTEALKEAAEKEAVSTLGILAFLLLSFTYGCSKQSKMESITVTFLDVEWEASDNLPELGEDLQAFTHETGIQVKRLPAPDSSLKQLALWKQILQKGQSTPDVYGIDVIWAGMLDQYFIDLKPDFAADLGAEDPTVAAAYTVGSKLVAMPRHAYVGLLFFRPDLLEEYGFRDPPRTWYELEKMAANIQKGERAKGHKDFWGYAWPAGIDEDLTCAGLEWQVDDGAGRIIEDDKTISVNNPKTVLVWQRAKRWLGTISPRSQVAYGKWDVDNLWDQGKTVFARGWATDSLISSAPLPTTRYGITSLPGGRAGRVDTLGGNGLAVSRNSQHPREAIQLIRFLRSRDVLRMGATQHSTLPKEVQLFALPSIFHLYPQLPKIRENGGRVVARPSIAAGTKYESVSRAYIAAARSVLLGEKSAPAAAAALEKELIEITGFSPGPPKDDAAPRRPLP